LGSGHDDCELERAVNIDGRVLVMLRSRELVQVTNDGLHSFHTHQAGVYIVQQSRNVAALVIHEPGPNTLQTE
jgi:hypothetical protein